MSRRTRFVWWTALAIISWAGAVRHGSAYVLEGPKWPGPNIPMVIQAGTPAFTLPDGFLSWNADAENALALWNEQLGNVHFTWTEAAVAAGAANHDGRNEVLFSGGVYNYSFGDRVLAVTLLNSVGGTMRETDVIFNKANNFSSGQNVNPAKDFHRVALHEFGHVLGLDHPDENHPNVGYTAPRNPAPSIMHSTVTSINELQPDDLAGITFLYGTPPSRPPLSGNARLANISTRAHVAGGSNVLIGGFIIRDQAKQILARALGPTLATRGITGPLWDPYLALHNADGSLIVANNNWKDTQGAQIQQTGLAPPSNYESAILATLQPGNYTAIVSGNAGWTGVGLAEIYDRQPAAGRLSNISTRAQVSTGQNVMIAGFIVHGPQLKSVVLRGLGPGLQGLLRTGVLPNTTIELRNSLGQLLQANTGWQTDPVSSTFVNIYSLAPPSTADSALYEQLAPGNYTAILKSPTNATGIGLLEVYDVH